MPNITMIMFGNFKNEHLGIVRSTNYKYGSILNLPAYDDEDPILANYTIDDIKYEADENLYWINKETKEVFSNNSKYMKI